MKRHTAEHKSRSYTALHNKTAAHKPPRLNAHNSKHVNQSKWSAQEDEMLLAEAQNTSKCKWNIVCKHLNKTFKASKRSAEDCKTRFNFLTKTQLNFPWTPNEDFLLLYFYHSFGENWDMIGKKLKHHSLIEIRSRFSDIATSIAEESKNKTSTGLTSVTPLDVLKAFYCLHLILECIQTNQRKHSEIYNIQAKYRLNEEECFKLINRVAGIFGLPPGKWTLEKLKKVVDSLFEKLQNSFTSIEDDNSFMQDIMHEPKELPVSYEPLMVPYMWIPMLPYPYPYGYLPFPYMPVFIN